MNIKDPILEAFLKLYYLDISKYSPTDKDWEFEYSLYDFRAGWEAGQAYMAEQQKLQETEAEQFHADELLRAIDNFVNEK